jgi:hypothetical protein
MVYRILDRLSAKARAQLMQRRLKIVTLALPLSRAVPCCGSAHPAKWPALRIVPEQPFDFSQGRAAALVRQRGNELAKRAILINLACVFTAEMGAGSIMRQ